MAIITAVYTVIRLNIIDIPLDRDEGGFGYIGQQILDVGLPYKDVFDHKPPLVFYINALALLFVPPTATGIHIFLHSYNFLTFISLYFLTKIYFKSESAGFWGALSYAIFSASPAIQGFTASTEMFMLLPIALSLLFSVLAVREQKLFFSILSGLFGAFACWTKLPATTCILFVFIYFSSSLTLFCVNQKKPIFINIFKPILFWLAGGFGISILICTYFYSKGIFNEFIYWVFKHSFLYSQQVDILDNLGKFYYKIKEVLKGDCIIIGFGIVVGVINMFKRNKSAYFVLGFLVFSFLGTIPGYSYAHYFAQVAPAVSIAGGFGFSFFIEAISRKTQRAFIIILCFLSVVGVPVLVHSEYYFKMSSDEISRNYFGYNPFPESNDISDFISDRTTPDDSILVFGSEPQILFLSQRKSATPYIFFYPLLQSFQRHKELQKTTLEGIQNKPPKYIIFVDIPTSLMWDGKADLLILNHTKQIIEKDYFLEAVMLIKEPKGELITISAMNDIDNSKIENYKYKILLFRMKG